MKKILVPTDFSACAQHAMDMGIALAELFEAQLFFVTVTAGSSPKGDLKNVVIKSFDNWEKEAKVRNVNLKTACIGGEFIPALQNYIHQNNIDFVVMGSHGASGKQEYFIGSNTQKAVRALHVPIFVIKQPLAKNTFDNVIFASSFDTNEKPAFLRFLDFIKWFKPKTVHLLSINTSGWFGQPALLMKEVMNDFKALCTDFKCKTHFYSDFTVDSGVRHFMDEIGADLIAISNRNRHPLKRIFSGSNVEALVNHCEQPVLSIDYVEAATLKTTS